MTYVPSHNTYSLQGVSFCSIYTDYRLPQFRDAMRNNQIDGIIYDRIYEEKTLSKRKPA